MTTVCVWAETSRRTTQGKVVEDNGSFESMDAHGRSGHGRQGQLDPLAKGLIPFSRIRFAAQKDHRRHGFYPARLQ